MRHLKILMLTVTCAALAAGLAGCSAGGAQKNLEGAVYAANTPVYKSAQFDGVMGGTSYGDTPEDTSEGQSWFFKVEEPYEQVVAFYDQKLSGWTRTLDNTGDGPYVTYHSIPPGAEPGEYVEVIVRQGEVQIHESCKPGKIKN